VQLIFVYTLCRCNSLLICVMMTKMVVLYTLKSLLMTGIHVFCMLHYLIE
jgi:hypothetical protein